MKNRIFLKIVSKALQILPLNLLCVVIYLKEKNEWKPVFLLNTE